MNLIDFHCDTMLRIYDGKGTMNLKQNSICIDEEKMRKAGSIAQLFAMYVDLEREESPFRTCNAMIEGFLEELARSTELRLALNFEDFEKNRQDGLMSAFIAVEEGGVVEGTMGKFYSLYDRGVRAITLTWNYPNEIGYPNRGWVHQNEGLTSFGRDLVGEMERLGVIPDVSHLSDGGFYDLLNYYRKPFMASHSNCRALCDHPRNLTDDMIRKLADRGGISGLNFESFFLIKQSERGELLFNGQVVSDTGDQDALIEELARETKMATIDHIADHAVHMIKIGGEDFPTIGGDLDGTTNLAGIRNISETPLLIDALKRKGVTERVIEKIFSENGIRFLRDALE